MSERKNGNFHKFQYQFYSHVFCEECYSFLSKTNLSESLNNNYIYISLFVLSFEMPLMYTMKVKVKRKIRYRHDMYF